MTIRFVSTLVVTVLALTINLAFAAGGKIDGPNVIAPDRYVYYPGTEVLAEDEVRVIACGTGIRETYDGPLSLAVDMMVWNITRDEITERMAVSPDRAWAVEGPTRQLPPEKGRPDVMSDFIKQGEWGPGFNAQNRMLDEYSKKFKLEDQDWRPQKPWYKPAE